MRDGKAKHISYRPFRCTVPSRQEESSQQKDLFFLFIVSLLYLQSVRDKSFRSRRLLRCFVKAAFLWDRRIKERFICTGEYVVMFMLVGKCVREIFLFLYKHDIPTELYEINTHRLCFHITLTHIIRHRILM